MKAKNRGSVSGCFMRFMVGIVLIYLLISWLPRCAQELPQLAGNAASNAANGVTSAAGNSLSNAGRRLLDRVEGWLGVLSPAEKFKLLCEHLPVEGVDKLCPYFTAALQGATEAQAAQTACYLTGVANAPNGQDTLQSIHKACPQTPNNAAAFQSCVSDYVTKYVEPGDVSSCQSGSEQLFESEVHTIIEPIACIPGLPKSWCTTQSSSTTTPAASQTTRTDQNYLNCLQKYYQLLPNYNEPLSCPNPTTITVQNAGCARGALLSWTYQGQHFGVAQVGYCDSPQSDPP